MAGVIATRATAKRSLMQAPGLKAVADVTLGIGIFATLASLAYAGSSLLSLFNGFTLWALLPYAVFFAAAAFVGTRGRAIAHLSRLLAGDAFRPAALWRCALSESEFHERARLCFRSALPARGGGHFARGLVLHPSIRRRQAISECEQVSRYRCPCRGATLAGSRGIHPPDPCIPNRVAERRLRKPGLVLATTLLQASLRDANPRAIDFRGLETPGYRQSSLRDAPSSFLAHA